MAKSVEYFATRTFFYGPGNGTLHDRGQIVDLCGMKNDEKLIRLRYVTETNPRASIVQCGHCGSRFVTDEALNTHGRERHSDRPLTPEQEDERAEKRAARDNTLMPLAMDKTAASRR